MGVFGGGASGGECTAWLRDRGFAFQTFATSGTTRCGTVVRDRSGAHAETTFLGPDTAPDAAAVRAGAEFLDAHMARWDGTRTRKDILALCGSFPGWSSAAFDPLRGAIERWLQRGIVVADTYGAPLDWLRARPLHLIKLNAHELGLAGLGPADGLPGPVQRWIVTDGPKPIRLRDCGEPGAPEHTLAPPRIAEVSATGSGDVLFACVLHGLFERGLSLVDATKFALPYAAANAAHEGIAEFPEPL